MQGNYQVEQGSFDAGTRNSARAFEPREPLVSVLQRLVWLLVHGMQKGRGEALTLKQGLRSELHALRPVDPFPCIYAFGGRDLALLAIIRKRNRLAFPEADRRELPSNCGRISAWLVGL